MQDPKIELGARSLRAQRELGRRLAEVLEQAQLPQPADRVQCLLALVHAEAHRQGYTREQLAEWALRAFDTFDRANARQHTPRT